jgi:hypothetical protein
MTLPKILARHDTVTIADQEIDIRTITRAEAAKLQKMAQDGAAGGDLEIQMIAFGTDTDPAEVKEWYAATPTLAVEELLDAIKQLSRFGDEEAQKSG